MEPSPTSRSVGEIIFKHHYKYVIAFTLCILAHLYCQPLQDNLASATYDTFEQCPTKYLKYEEVILIFLPRGLILICIRLSVSHWKI